MSTKNKKASRRIRIKMRIRKTVTGTPERPRMSVYRSNKQIYVQLIDDMSGRSLVAASSHETADADSKITKTEQAALVGKKIAEKAIAAGFSSVVFDRNGYLYHGRIKSLADAAREGGLKF